MCNPIMHLLLSLNTAKQETEFRIREALIVEHSGKLKDTIVNEFKEAGIHAVNFNASELYSSIFAKGGNASGVYFYKLEVDNFVKIRKMNLIK